MIMYNEMNGSCITQLTVHSFDNYYVDKLRKASFHEFESTFSQQFNHLRFDRMN